jgi:hypothetical protein
VLAPEIELPLLGVVSSESIGLGLTAASLGLGTGVAVIDCRHDVNAQCVIEGASIVAGGAGLVGGLAFSSFGPFAGLGHFTEYGAGFFNYGLGGAYSLGFGAASLFGTQFGLDASGRGCP